MRRYVVTAGYVTVETELPGGGRAHVDVRRGELLPDDVPDAQVEHELGLRTIEAVDEPKPATPTAAVTPPGDPADPAALPDGLSVPGTLEWVGADKDRAQVALDAETSPAGKDRATLVDRLNRVLAAE